MATNPIPNGLDELLALAEDAADGAQTHEVAIGLKQCTEATIRADLSSAKTKRDAHAAAVADKPALATTVRVEDSNGKAIIGITRDVLIPRLGGQWSQQWADTGFPNQSLAVPKTQGERQTLLGSLQTYFVNNPTHEVAALGVTAAALGAQFTALSDARSAFNGATANIGQLMDVRDLAVIQLKKRLRALIDELTLLLDKNDPRWYAFGFVPPGADQTPDQVEGVEVQLGPDNTLLVQWLATALADSYHIEIQVVGVDADFHRVATVSETNTILSAQPAGATVRVRVLAVNGSLEGPPSAVVETILPVNP